MIPSLSLPGYLFYSWYLYSYDAYCLLTGVKVSMRSDKSFHRFESTLSFAQFEYFSMLPKVIIIFNKRVDELIASKIDS